jgi:hypothetical protein
VGSLSGRSGAPHFAVGVAEVAAQGEGLLVVVQGLMVLAGVVGDVAQAVQRVRLARAVQLVPQPWIVIFMVRLRGVGSGWSWPSVGVVVARSISVIGG